MMSSWKILSVLFVLAACQESEFYDVPKPASLEFGQSIRTTSFSYLNQESEEKEEWVKMESFDLGRQPMGTVSLFEFGFRNVGNLPAIIKEIRLVGENTDSFFLTHNCLKAIKSGAKCPIALSYKPDTIGKMPSKVHVTYDNGTSGEVTKILPISAAANNLAFLKFESNVIDFKKNTIGQTASAYLRVLYNGSNISVAGHTILPARGVIMADPSESSIVIDRGPETTCGEIIKSDCVIKVNFKAQVEAIKTGSIGLTYFNGAEVLKIEASASGSGILGTRLAELSASNMDFGSVIVNAASPVGHNLNVYFNGSVAAENVEFVAPSSASFAIDGARSTCTETISGNCSLFVTFNPASSGNHSDSIKIKYTSQGITQPNLSVSLSGKGVGAALLKSDVNTLAFGVQPAHKGATKYFNLSNAGQVALSALSALTVSDDSFTAAFESCANLGAGGACRIKVVFAPKTSAAYTASIQFSYHNGKESVPVTLEATGSGSSPLVMEGSRTIDFGNVMIGHPVLPNPVNVGLGVYGTTLLSNASQLILSTPNLNNPFSFVAASTPGTTSSCRAPLNPNTMSSCSFGVALIANTGFAPDVAVTENFSMGYTGDGGNGTGVLNFVAKMTPRVPPTLSIQSAEAFKPVSVNNSMTVKYVLKNNSPYFATSFKTISISGSSAFKVSANGCSGGVVANGTCNIMVTFKPDDAGSFGGILTYTYSDQIQNQSLATALSAEGSADVTLIADSATIDFGSVFVGDVISAKDIKLTYFGKNAWTSSSSVGTPFALNSSDCGAARDCTMKVNFAPTSAGTFNTNVKFTYAPGLNTPSEINFVFKGVAKLRSATLALSPLNFPKTLKGESVEQTLTLKNNGTLLASDISVVAPTGEFEIVDDLSATNCAVKTSLDQNESCTVKVKFSPVAVAKSTSALNVNYQNGSSAQTLANTITGQGTQMIKVFAGAFQTCLINELGKPLCWGRYLPVQKPQDISPMDFGAGVVITKLSLGDKHACALTSAGKVSCWSNIAAADDVNLDGELASDISAGFEHTCALLKNGKVKCWGENSSGQLGSGVNDFGVKAVSVAAGAGHTCVLLENDSMKCWGDNFYGQLGRGIDTEKLSTPGEAVNLGSFRASAIAASSGAFTCAVSTSGSVKCFGKTVANELATPFYGVLGHCWARSARNAAAYGCPSDMKFASSSIGYFANDMGDNLAKVNLGSSVVEEISVGSAFSCGLLADKSVKCWGLNLSGQLGVGHKLNIGAKQSEMGDNLVAVKLERGAVQVATGYEHACAVLDNNTVKCWGTGLNNATGLNAHGIIANTATENSSIPSALPVVYSGK